MSGHTEGPWSVGRDGGHNANIIYGPDLEGIASLYNMPMHTRDVDVCERFAQGMANARLIAASPDLLTACKALLARDERNTCIHEETYRGGSIWEICHQCGAKWADDEGGKPEWQDPPEWEAARAAIAKAEQP